MKSKPIIVSLIVFSISIFFCSCESENEGENETKISSNGSKESHKIGQNCMNCHYSGGSGEGWFTIAGTIYDSLQANIFPDGAVNFYTGPNETGTLKYIVAGDVLGNFYTTQSIDFGDGLYTSVKGDKSTQYMITKITSGQCNSCHGSTTDKIWTK